MGIAGGSGAQQQQRGSVDHVLADLAALGLRLTLGEPSGAACPSGRALASRRARAAIAVPQPFPRTGSILGRRR